MQKTNSTLRSLILGSLVLMSFGTKAQNFIGLQHSNLSGIHQARLNPANIADARQRLYVNGYTMGFGFNNDYVQLDLPFSIFGFVQKNKVPSQYKTGNKINFDNAWFTENLNGKSKNLNVYTEIRSPGAMLKVTKVLSLGFQFRNMVSFQVSDVAEPLARLARYGVDSTKGTTIYSGPNQFKIGDKFTDNKFAINFNSWGELAGTIALRIINSNALKIKVGFTPKYLLGYMSGYVKNEGVQFKIINNDSVIFEQTNLSYGYTEPTDFLNIDPRNPIGFIKTKLKSGGFGYDAGFTFEYNPKATKALTSQTNKYLVRGGISLLDGGSISYGSSMKSTTITGNSINKVFAVDANMTAAFAKSKKDGILYVDSVAKTLFDINNSNGNVETKMPTTLNFQIDYNVLKILYVGANWSQDLLSKNISGIRRPSYIILIPRIETRLFEIAVPIGLMNDYKTGRIGAFIRVGPVFIGTDNLVGQIRSSKYYGSDIYFGASTSIPSKKKK